MTGIIAGCVQSPDSGNSASSGSGAGSSSIEAPDIRRDGRPIVVDVDHSHTLATEIPGLGRLTAPSGAFRTSGQIVIQKLHSQSPANSPIEADGPGIDVTFRGTSLASPLTIYFDDPAVAKAIPSGAVPVVLHKPDGRAWETREISYTSDGVPYLITSDFSPNIFSWIQLPQWMRDLPHSVSDWVSGSATQRPCVGGGPAWAQTTSSSYLIYECVITNTASDGTPRAELQIQNSREHFEWIAIPKGADYVWVDGQPDPVRNLIAHVTGHATRDYVLLGPGQWMSIGFRQSATAAEEAFRVEQDRWSFVLGAAQALVGFSGNGNGMLALLVLAGKCYVEGKRDLAGYFECFAKEGFSELSDPKKAVAAAGDILGDRSYDSAYTDELTSIASKLQSMGRLVQAGGLLEAFHVILIPVLDAVVTLQNPSNISFALHLGAAHVAAPVAPAPSASATPQAEPPASPPSQPRAPQASAPPKAVPPESSPSQPPAPPSAPAPVPLPKAWVTRDGNTITYHWSNMPPGMWSQVDRFRCWRYSKTTHPGGWATDGCGQVTGYSGYPSGDGQVSFTYGGATDAFSVEPWHYGPWLGVGESCQVGGSTAC